MIKDLNLAEEAIEIDSDYAIVGGGTVGLILATLLSKNGSEVVVLESGGRDRSNSEVLNQISKQSTEYPGATSGRERNLGGNSLIWGGALIPFEDADFDKATWPISSQNLAEFIPIVEALFSLPPGPYSSDDSSFDLKEFQARYAKWPSFKKRNVAELLSKTLESDSGPLVYLNAHVQSLIQENGSIENVFAKSFSGQQVQVNAKKIIVCAGAIETTRLLLTLQKSMFFKENPSIDSNIIAPGFSDHISVVVGNFEIFSKNRFNRIFGYQFSRKGGMRNLRFEIARNSELRKKLPPCFFHFSFESNGLGSFESVREILRKLQIKELPKIIDVLGLFKNPRWLAKALWWRFVYKRLIYPENAQVQLHLVIEQAHSKENQIRLSKNEFDHFGSPLPIIEWKVNDIDKANILLAKREFEVAWNNSKFSHFAKIDFRNDRDILEDSKLGNGIYHPTGSTPMGSNESTSIVDDNLRVHKSENLYLLSTSTFPNGGGANPTMTLILLACRLSEHFEKLSNVE
jgi:hypothetical protein